MSELTASVGEVKTSDMFGLWSSALCVASAPAANASTEIADSNKMAVRRIAFMPAPYVERRSTPRISRRVSSSVDASRDARGRSPFYVGGRHESDSTNGHLVAVRDLGAGVRSGRARHAQRGRPQSEHVARLHLADGRRQLRHRVLGRPRLRREL